MTDSRYVVTFRAEVSFSVVAATPAAAEEQARLLAFYMDDETIRHEETVGHLRVVKYVRTEDSPDPDDEDQPEPSDTMGYCDECGDAIRRDEENEILNGGDRVHTDCMPTPVEG